jgi:hypothetical protein
MFSAKCKKPITQIPSLETILEKHGHASSQINAHGTNHNAEMSGEVSFPSQLK